MKTFTTWKEVYDFWFGDVGKDPTFVEEKSQLWWNPHHTRDEIVKAAFQKILPRVASGGCEDWKNGPDSCLSGIVVLGQVPRHFFRNQPESFAYDQKALIWASEALEKKYDQQVPLMLRIFFYLPLEHAENLILQRQSVALTTELYKNLAEIGFEKMGEEMLKYAKIHMEIIEAFGRFPHRNSILKRISTPAEEKYLKTTQAKFW